MAMIRSIRSFRLLLGAAMLAILFTGTAAAHKIKIFAVGNGKRITGSAYFSGGAKAINAKVIITAANGEKLGETRTGTDGKFSFQAEYYCDHLLAVDSGDGHHAEWTVKKEELSKALPRLPSAGALQNNAAPAEETATGNVAAPAGETEPGNAAAPAADLREEIRELSAQVIKLREQLDAFEEEIRLRDVLGGIGFLIGLSGIIFYLLAKRSSRETIQ